MVQTLNVLLRSRQLLQTTSQKHGTAGHELGWNTTSCIHADLNPQIAQDKHASRQTINFKIVQPHSDDFANTWVNIVVPAIIHTAGVLPANRSARLSPDMTESFVRVVAYLRSNRINLISPSVFRCR